MKKSKNKKCFEISVSNYEDIILARQKVKLLMQDMGFSLLAQTRIITAVSELARNIVIHAGQGSMSACQVVKKGKISAYELNRKKNVRGLECVFEDNGPGIADIGEAMKEGFTTSNSLGLGLGGARRLCKEFRIESTVGKGTKITITEWL